MKYLRGGKGIPRMRVSLQSEKLGKKYIYFLKSSKTHIEIGKSEAQCSAADADGQIPSQVSPTTLSSSTQRRLWQLKNVFRRERKIPFFYIF